jgi:hypothetical protein
LFFRLGEGAEELFFFGSIKKKTNIPYTCISQGTKVNVFMMLVKPMNNGHVIGFEIEARAYGSWAHAEHMGLGALPILKDVKYGPSNLGP